MDNNVIKYQKMVVEKVKEQKERLGFGHDVDNAEKMNPIVVALLVSESGEQIFSYRSEMIDGDHAEYNLFTNKLKGEDHSNDTLYVSLEPCNYESRLNTISCSELIVKAKIKKVYMGCFDPDIMVRGNGYSYLKENGVEVLLFEEEFQKELIEANWPFYRDKLYENEDSRRFLSTYKDLLSDKAIAYFMMACSDLIEEYDDYFVENYLNQTNNLRKTFFDKAFEKQFIYRDVKNGKRVITADEGFELSFFSTPTNKYHGACIKIINQLTNRESPTKTFNGPIIIAYSKALTYLYSLVERIVNINEINGVLRELLANAVFHKDYSSYAPITVKVFKERIEICNPCKKQFIDINRLNNYDMPTNPINGCLTDIALDMRLIEGQGRGEETLESYSSAVNYELICNILKVTIFIKQ